MGERLHRIADPHGMSDEVRVVIVDRADTLGPELGPGPRPYIESVVGALGVEQRLGRTVESVTPDQVVLSDGEVSLPPALSRSRSVSVTVVTARGEGSAAGRAGVASLCVADAVRCRGCRAAASRPAMGVCSRMALWCAPAFRRCDGPVRSCGRRRAHGAGVRCAVVLRSAVGHPSGLRSAPLPEATAQPCRPDCAAPRPCSAEHCASLVAASCAQSATPRRTVLVQGTGTRFPCPVKGVPVDLWSPFQAQTGAGHGDLAAMVLGVNGWPVTWAEALTGTRFGTRFRCT